MKHVVKLSEGTSQNAPQSQTDLDQQAVDTVSNNAVNAVKAAEEIRANNIIADLTRAEFLNNLRTKTLTEIDTFVRAKVQADSINSAAVTSLATAQACLTRVDAFAHRVETALATILKLIALDARQ